MMINVMTVKRLEYILIAFVIILFVLKLAYLGVGAYAITDEWRYDLVFSLIEAIKQVNYEKFSKVLVDTNGRPGELFIRLPFAIIQILWYKLTGEPVSYSNFIPQFHNYIVVFLNTVLVYKICHNYGKGIQYNKIASLICVIIYCALLNHGFYVRHLLPYDNALLFFLIALYHITQKNNPSYWLTGVFIGLGFSIYPGYFLFVGILMSAILIKSSLINNLKNLLKAGIGALLVLAFWEAITNIGGYSYISSLKTLSGTITQGSFEEGLIYPFLYLWQVESITGIALVINIFLLFSYKRNCFTSDYTDTVIKLGFLFLIAYALQCYFLQKMVFYGRILHMFMPLLILSVYPVIMSLTNKVNKEKFLLVSFLIITFIVIDFIVKSVTFTKISYPRDILLSYGINKWEDTSLITEKSNNRNFSFEIDNVAYRPDVQLLADKYKNLLFINFAYFHPVSLSRYEEVNSDSLIFASPHFQSHYVYSYEGLSYHEREFLRNKRLQLKIFLLRK